MDYRATVAHLGALRTPPPYSDATAALLLHEAVTKGWWLNADADTATITLRSADEQLITLRPADPLPAWTTAQRREVLALAVSPGPVEWARGQTNVVRLRDGARLLRHDTTMALIDGGYLTPSRKSGPAALSLLAWLTIGTRPSDRPKAVRDELFTNMLRRAYSTRPPVTVLDQETTA